jgi:metal-responsive CopG/Arc/MetJ family transcriptional regulator
MPQKTKVAGFSVSLPPFGYEFDEAWQSMKYENRSKAVHEALRSFITEFEWTRKDSGRITGAVLVLYCLNKPGRLEGITKAQHQFKNVISSALQYT